MPDTRLYDDLGIYGDDATEMLVNYGKKFNVDVSKFRVADYFMGEGDNAWIDGLIRFFTGRRPSTGLKVLKVKDLERGIKAGRLDETVIQSGDEKEGICQV